jgi:hypothetical protein
MYVEGRVFEEVPGVGLDIYSLKGVVQAVD